MMNSKSNLSFRISYCKHWMLKAWFYSQLYEYNVESYHSFDDGAVTIQSGHSDICTDQTVKTL